MEWPGSRRRVRQLVDEHYQSLYGYAYRLSGSAADADDLTQEAFCKAQLQLHQLREPAKAKGWLFRIVRNAYLHRIRAQKLHPAVSLDAVGDLAEPVPESPTDIDPEQLRQALADLPEAFRTPLILFYFEEFSYRDIAEHLDVPIGTVMSRLARAKAHIRSQLAAEAATRDGPSNGGARHAL